MQTQVFEMSANGGLQPVDKNAFKNLEPGTTLLWGGNQAWGPTRFCILTRRESNYGVMYACYNMDEPDKNAHLHQVEAWSIKDPNDKSVWHSQHMFIQPETVDPEMVEIYRKDHELRSQAKQEQEDAAKREADRLEALGRELWPSLIGNCPAVIIAELEQDESDSQTDYFASRTIGKVILAPSSHKRDLFPEMRKAAELLPETSHLGIGKGRFTPYVEIGKDFINVTCYYKGSRSHWHGELDHDERGNNPVFSTLAEAQAYVAQKGDPEPISFDGEIVPFSWNIQEESIEHREKWSMGKGYYLGTSHYSGWQISKEVFYKGEPQREHFIALAKRHDHLVKGKPQTPSTPSEPRTENTNAAYTVEYDRDWTWVKFASKPAESVLANLKNAGARFSGKRVAWYFTKHLQPAEIGL